MSSSKYCRLCPKVTLSMQAGDAAVSVASAASRTIMAESYLPPNPGPYPQDKPPENKVRFTPVQVGTPELVALIRGSAACALIQRCRPRSHCLPQQCPMLLFMKGICITQVEAIRAGTQPGLTMVVGPPGTGKTDTAVQIMHVLYHNCPSQRTLLIAHSNQVHLTSCSRASQSAHK